MPKRKKKATPSKKKKEDSAHDSSPPSAKRVETAENEASSTSQFEEEIDHVQSFTSIAILNSKSEQSHYWCNYCSFSTEHKKELITHMREHMNKCPFCSFTSLSMKEVAKHCKNEHDKDLDTVSQETESSTSCEMDKDPCSACVFCEFMTYSTEHLERHTILKHPGMLAKSVAKMITKQSSAQIRKDDALFYLTISNESLSDIKKSTAELSTIVIDVAEEKHVKDVKLETFRSPAEIKVNELQTKASKEKVEVHLKSHGGKLSAEHDDIREDITSSGNSVGRIVKVETMYCLTCPYSNVYIEKLKCHTLAQHPLGPAACSYNSLTENSGDTEVTFFCIREDCSYNTVDSKAYQKHLMDCCSYRSVMTVIEKERLQASIANVRHFQRKFNKDAEIGFSDFALTYFNYPDSSTSTIFRSQLKGEAITAERNNLETPSSLKNVPEGHQIINPAHVQQLGSSANIIQAGRQDKAPEIYPADNDKLMIHSGNILQQMNGNIQQRLAIALSSDILNVNMRDSSPLPSASNFVNIQHQKKDHALSKTILLSEQSTPQIYISPAGADREKLVQLNDGVLTNSAKTAFTHDSLSQPILAKPTSLVEGNNAEMWQNSMPMSSTALFTHQQPSQMTHNIVINETSTSTGLSVQQTDVPNFLVTSNCPMPETDTNGMAQTNSTFLTPNKNSGILAECLATPPKNTSTQYMTNAAGSSPLSPSIYLSGQVPRHRRTNWTNADMQPRGMMAAPVGPRYQVPLSHNVRQRLFTPANMRGRNTRGRVRMPHTPRQNTNVDDDDVIVTAVVRTRQNPSQPATVGPPTTQIGRMAPMQRLTPQTANKRMSSPMQNFRAAAPPKQQFDISKHFEDLACVVNSTGDEDGVSQVDDDIQILAVTPARLSDKDKSKQQPRAVDASKFSFCCVHCGKDQGSKNQMKQHMKAYHNDSLIGAFTNTETGQLLYFCPQLTCEFMTYEERRLSEHLYKCYNLDNSKPFDVITAIKNLKSLKIRQLDVRSMGRSQNNPIHLDGQGLKDNFSNSLNDAFDDIVVNASGRYIPKSVSTHRPTQINQNNSAQLHQNNSTKLHQNNSTHLHQNYSTQLNSNNSAPPRPPVRPVMVRHYPTPRPSFGPQSPYAVRPQHNEMMRPRFPTPRLDTRPPRAMHTRPRVPTRTPIRPCVAGLCFGGEQEPIVIDDEPSVIYGNTLTSGSVYANENSTIYPMAGEGKRHEVQNMNNTVNDYSFASQTVSDFPGLHNSVDGSSEIAQHLYTGSNFTSTTSNEFCSSSSFTSDESRSSSNFAINTSNEPSSSNNSAIYTSNQPSSSNNFAISTANQPSSSNNFAINTANQPSSSNNFAINTSNQPSSSNNFAINTSNQLSSNSFAENNALHPTITHENVTANVSWIQQNASGVNTPVTKLQTPGSETFTSSTLESVDEEEEHYAYMLEKVFAKVPNMPKTLSRRLISKFKQYSQSIGVKINSNVIDEFVSKISYKGSSAAKAPASSTVPPVEKLNTCTGEEPRLTNDHPDQSAPDVLTTQIIMAERKLKFSGSFANIPLKTSDDTIARVEERGGGSDYQANVEERGGGSDYQANVEERGGGSDYQANVEERGGGSDYQANVEERGSGSDYQANVEERGGGSDYQANVEERGGGSDYQANVEERGGCSDYQANVEERGVGSDYQANVEERGVGSDYQANVEERGGRSDYQAYEQYSEVEDVQKQKMTDSVDGKGFQSARDVLSVVFQSDVKSNKPSNKKATNRQLSQSKKLTRRHSADVINEHTQAIETIRSSSCPLTVPCVPKTISRRKISSCMVADDFESPIQLNFVSPAITQKESCLSFISTSSPIVITSSVDHIVSGNADLEVDIAGRPENTHLLLVEKLEPPETQDQELFNRLYESDATAQKEKAQIKLSDPLLILPVTIKNDKAISGKNQKIVKKSSISKKKKTPNIPPAEKLILKVRKRGRPRTKLIEDVKLDPNSACKLDANKTYKLNANDDTEVLENLSCKDKLDVMGESLNTEECDSSNTIEGTGAKTKDAAAERLNEDDKSVTKDLDDPSTEIFIRRSDRKRKAINSDFRVEQEAELDELLGEKDEDYFIDDDDSDNDESTWMKESGLASKKKIKKIKPPPDPTAFDVATKGKFKCWLCKKVFLKSTFAKAHLLKKHKEGLCSIDLLQTEETGALHLLLYCLRDCKYATFSLEGLKNHIASCQKPEYTDQDDNYVQLNQDFIDCFYPELMKSDVQELLQPKLPKDTSKSSKSKKAKQSKDVKSSLHTSASTSEDASKSEQSSVSLPLQRAVKVCEISQQIPPFLSPLELLVTQETTDFQSHTPAQLQTARNYNAVGPHQHCSTVPPAPRFITEQIDSRLCSQQQIPRVPPPQISQRFSSPQSFRLLGDQIVPRLSAEKHAPSHSIDQRGPRLMNEQHPLRPVPNQTTAPKFTEHPRPPVRQSMQSKHNITHQLPNTRPMSWSAWQTQAPTDSDVQFTHSSDLQTRQVPKCPPSASQMASGQSSHWKNPNVASNISQWHVASHPNDAPQEQDSIYVEENGTICLE